jgi:predicted O-methyltransferase YrrM
MNRRASLPGADELFGSSSNWSQRVERGEEPSSSEGDRVDARVLAGVRRLTAVENSALQTARDAAGATLSPPSPDVGALLRWAVHTTQAQTAVEIGAAGGVSGLWLLGALPERGVLTSIEPDAHGHELASDAFRAARAGQRVRSIQGDPATVLPRLSDHAYDLALLQANPVGYPEDLEHIRRLLRPGGMLIARGVLQASEHIDELARFIQELAEDPSFTTAVLPVDGGLALATRRPDRGGA